MTRFVTLVDAPLPLVVKKLNAYLDPHLFSTEASDRWERIAFQGDFRSGLEALTPCDRLGNARSWLAIQVQNRWTALFNNGFGHNPNLSAWLSRTLQTELHNIAADGNLASPKRELLMWSYYLNGTPRQNIWAKSGKVFLGEHNSLVSDKNNFTSKHLVDYLAGLGLRPHEDSFYDNALIILLKPPARLESPRIGLQAARTRWLKRGRI